MREHLEEQRERERLRMIERRRGRHGLLHDRQRRVGKPAQEPGARQLAAAEDPGLDPGLPHARAVERRVVERQRLLEVLVRRLERAEMEQRRADRPLADHLQVRIAEALEERHHLQRDVVRDPDLARDDVMRRHADEDGNDPRRILDLPAQLAGALVGAPDLGDGIALAGLDRERVGHLQPELGGGALGARRLVRRGAPIPAAPAAPIRRARTDARPPAPRDSSTPRRGRCRARLRTARAISDSRSVCSP